VNIQVEREFDRTMDLFCFGGEIRQVFANLVGNAIDAMGIGGRLVVRARRSRNWRNPDWKNPENSGVRFCVADTGSGMDQAVQKRVFEAFFTTKDETGTGLGLWVSEEIVRKHKGMIHLRSRPIGGEKSSGTVFQIYIPDDPNLSANPAPVTAAAPGAGGATLSSAPLG